MAKVINSYIGQLSGKLGGMVFSRNAGGAYVRANVKGTNPQTISQVQARNAFASVATLFRGLSSAEKSQWQEFADNYYSPRGGGNTGQFSAYNAFIALRSTVQQTIRYALSDYIAVNGSEPAGGKTQVPFTPMPETPVATTLLPALATVGGDSALLSVTSAELFTDGHVRVELQVGDGTGVDLVNNQDINGNVIGYAVYYSNGNPSDNMAYANPEANCAGYFEPWLFDVPGTDALGVQTYTFDVLSGLSIGRFKRFPLINEYVLISVYAMNKYGMMTLIGSVESQVLV